MGHNGIAAEALQLKPVTSTHLGNGLPAPSITTARESRTRLSTGSASDDPEKKLRGFQHIIQELSAENAELKEKYTSVMEEIELLKEVKFFGQDPSSDTDRLQEVKLLEEATEIPNGEQVNGNASVNCFLCSTIAAADFLQKDLALAKAAILTLTETIQDVSKRLPNS